ncbi:MAG: immunity 17 family protein [Coprobacter sp.]|nr:immunity 17 family protein [Coprobacter sp.]
MQASTIIVVSLFFVLGLLSLAASLADWNWFFESKNVALFVRWLGRTGARILYALLGAFILGMAFSVGRTLW